MMRRRLPYCLVLMVLLLGLPACGVLADESQPQSGTAYAQVFAATVQQTETDQDDFENYSWLIIYLDPRDELLDAPGEILVTDPLGRRVGWDTDTGGILTEISGSCYDEFNLDDDETGEPGPVSKELDLRKPVAGRYRLCVIGTAARVYGLYLHYAGADPKAPSKDASVEDVEIAPGEVQVYEFACPGDGEGGLTLQRIS